MNLSLNPKNMEFLIENLCENNRILINPKHVNFFFFF